MSNITSSESFHRAEVLNKTWEYLNDNFHKFTEDKKIKISIALCTKSMPQVVEGNYSVTKLDRIKIDDKELEYNVGNRIGLNAEHPSEVTASN